MENTSSIPALFSQFTAGAPDMDGKTFLKFCKDSNLLDKTKMTSTDVDIIFAQVKAKGARKIDANQFKAACEKVATKKGISMADLLATASAAGGPKFVGTKADFVKFHDDKTTYTGVYAQGGPTNVDTKGGQISDISQLCDRTSADVRGIKKQ